MNRWRQGQGLQLSFFNRQIPIAGSDNGLAQHGAAGTIHGDGFLRFLDGHVPIGLAVAVQVVGTRKCSSICGILKFIFDREKVGNVHCERPQAQEDGK